MTLPKITEAEAEELVQYLPTSADEWKITYGMLTIGDKEIGKPIEFTPSGQPVGVGIANQNLIIAAPQMHEELTQLRQDKGELVKALALLIIASEGVKMSRTIGTMVALGSASKQASTAIAKHGRET